MLPRKRDQLLAFAIENGVDLGALFVRDVAGQDAQRLAGAIAMAAGGQVGQSGQISQRADQTGMGTIERPGGRVDASQASAARLP